MKEKSLKSKATNIKGKLYVEVPQRVLYFNENYENGVIKTELLTDPDSKIVAFKAFVIPDCDKPDRFFTGHSQEVWGEGFINKTSALENAETSAVGRALGMMGIGVIDSIASVDEINKAKGSIPFKGNEASRRPTIVMASDEQIHEMRNILFKMAKAMNMENPEIDETQLKILNDLKIHKNKFTKIPSAKALVEFVINKLKSC